MASYRDAKVCFRHLFSEEHPCIKKGLGRWDFSGLRAKGLWLKKFFGVEDSRLSGFRALGLKGGVRLSFSESFDGGVVLGFGAGHGHFCHITG